VAFGTVNKNGTLFQPPTDPGEGRQNPPARDQKKEREKRREKKEKGKKRKIGTTTTKLTPIPLVRKNKNL